MELFLGMVCAIVLLATLFNTMLLIGIAGSVAKLIRSMQGEDKDDKDRDKWASILRQRRTLQMQEGNEASYADTAALSPSRPPDSRYWDGVPRGPNWDGIPKVDDEE
jgi:hypothetical protein